MAALVFGSSWTRDWTEWQLQPTPQLWQCLSTYYHQKLTPLNNLQFDRNINKRDVSFCVFYFRKHLVSLYNMSYFCQGWLETKTPRPLTTLLAPPTQCLAESPATLLRFLLRLGYLLPFCPAGVLSSAVFSLSRVSHDLGLPSSEGCPETWTPAPRQTVLGTPGWPVTWLPILPEPFHSSSWLHLIPITTSAQTTQARNLGVIILHFSLATELPNFVSSPSQVILDSMPSKFLDWTFSIPSVNSFLSPFSHSLSTRLPR